MSVILAREGGGALVLTKGADTVMEELLGIEGLPRTAQDALTEFSRAGLRTLVLGQREMDEETFKEWQEDWRMANTIEVDRAETLDKVYEQAEIGLTYIGITALEDRLQT